MPYLIEASGSIDSYHVWIFLEECKSWTAYNFSRKLAKEANVKCEIFPKQKKLSGGKYGNMVKLPFGVNRKNGNRSKLLNDDLQPIEINLSNAAVVQLYEEFEPQIGKPRGKGGIIRKVQRPQMITSTSLYPCMRGVLAEGMQLTGGSGHTFRQAIAIMALNCGMDIEAAAGLFKGQSDFNREFSIKKVGEVVGWHPYSCEKLRDLCFDLVAPYCSECNFAKAEWRESTHQKEIELPLMGYQPLALPAAQSVAALPAPKTVYGDIPEETVIEEVVELETSHTVLHWEPIVEKLAADNGGYVTAKQYAEAAGIEIGFARFRLEISVRQNGWIKERIGGFDEVAKVVYWPPLKTSMCDCLLKCVA